MPTRDDDTQVACLLADEDVTTIREALAGEPWDVSQVRTLREVLDFHTPTVLLLSADEYYPWLAVLEQVLDMRPETRVVMICDRSNSFVRGRAIASGVAALLLKPLAANDVRNVIRWTAGTIRQHQRPAA